MVSHCQTGATEWWRQARKLRATQNHPAPVWKRQTPLTIRESDRGKRTVKRKMNELQYLSRTGCFQDDIWRRWSNPWVWYRRAHLSKVIWVPGVYLHAPTSHHFPSILRGILERQSLLVSRSFNQTRPSDHIIHPNISWGWRGGVSSASIHHCYG